MVMMVLEYVDIDDGIVLVIIDGDVLCRIYVPAVNQSCVSNVKLMRNCPRQVVQQHVTDQFLYVESTA
jgi:hypothetical protein